MPKNEAPRNDFFPHLVTKEADDWTIEYRNAGHTINTKKRVVAVPRGPRGRDLSDSAKHVRLFQLARAKHSPEEDLEPGRNTEDLFRMAMEEVRVSSILRNQYGIDVSQRYDTAMNSIRDSLPSMKRKDMAAAYMLMKSLDENDYATRLADDIWEKLEPNKAEQAAITESLDLMDGIGMFPEFTPTKAQQARNKAATRLVEIFEPPPPPSPMIEALTNPDAKGDDLDELLEGLEEGSGPPKKEMKEVPFKEGPLKPIPGGIGDAPSIGAMLIHDHIVRNRASRPIRLPNGAKATGVVPTRWERLCIDGTVFIGRRKGGAVVIDCSGSMAWDFEYLARQVLKLPALKVGCYAGDDAYGRRKGWNGQLCVIAKDGRYDPYCGPKAGGNGVDYEALLWVASQKKPRVFVSDGEACGGTYGHDRTKLADMCEAVMAEYDIWRVETIEEAIDYITRRRVPKGATKRMPESTWTRLNG